MKPALNVPSNYFQTIIIFLKVVGIWLDKAKENVGYQIYSTLILILIFLYPVTVVIDLIEEEYDDFVNLLTFLFLFTAGSFKGVVLYINRKKISTILQKLEKEPFLPNENRGGSIELTYIQRFSKINTIQVNFYLSLAIPYATAMFIYSILYRIIYNKAHNWPQAYNTFSIVNTSYSPNFEIVTIYQTAAVFGLAMFFAISDLIVAGILCNISYQFKILRSFLEHQFDLDNKKLFLCVGDGDYEISWVYFKGLIKSAVDYHLEIINLTKEVEEIFSIPLLILFLNSLAILSCMIYTITTLSVSGALFFRRIAESSASAFQVYLISYYGERIRTESENVGNAAYNVSVVSEDSRYRQALRMIMLRSQTPVTLTTAKFTDIRISSFAWIMRTSYSIFMLMRKTSMDE